MVVADRMAGVGLLAAGVAHELRNALTTVVMNNDLALESLQGTDDADLAESLEAVAAAAESLKQLTTDLARVGRSEESGETVGRPADAVGLAVRLTSGRVRSRARVEVVVNDTPAVPLSNLRLQQITVNLIQNAVQAFEAAPREGGNTVTLTVGSDTGGAYVQVRDDGPGMPEGVCAQAFEPFFTTRGHAAGTGLGLYVCKALVEEVGGTIELSSTLGEGSCVTIRLPTTDVANGAPIDGTADPEASFSLARGDTSG